MTETVQRDPVTFGRTTKTLCTLWNKDASRRWAVRAVDSLFRSRTNGNVMRTLPVGLVCNPRMAAAEAQRVLAFTHFDPAAGDCCAAVSTAAAVLLAGGEREDALAAARNAAGRTDLFSDDLIPSVDAVEAIRCAFFFFRQAASVRDCIEQVATLGGGTDTIAAIAGGLAGAYFGMEKYTKRVGVPDRYPETYCSVYGALTSARDATRRV